MKTTCWQKQFESMVQIIGTSWLHTLEREPGSSVESVTITCSTRPCIVGSGLLVRIWSLSSSSASTATIGRRSQSISTVARIMPSKTAGISLSTSLLLIKSMMIQVSTAHPTQFTTIEWIQSALSTPLSVHTFPRSELLHHMYIKKDLQFLEANTHFTMVIFGWYLRIILLLLGLFIVESIPCMISRSWLKMKFTTC